jgi:hypothetical protein
MRAISACIVYGFGSLLVVFCFYSPAARAVDPSPNNAAPLNPATTGPKPPEATGSRTPIAISPFDRPAAIAAEFGHNGGGPFRQVPGNGAVLVGCEVTLFQFGPSAVIIKSIKPIFELPDGSRKDGATQGDPTRWTVRVEAEKGFAVGKMAGRFGDRIDGFYMVFMRRHADRLDANDQYPSRWLGARSASGLVEVNDPKGRAAVGLSGRCGADVDALSLVFE